MQKFFGKNLSSFFSSESAESTATLTIYVHGPNGKQDYLLESEGELLVDLGGDRRYPKIGEKGRTVLSEIPAKFKGKEILISVKAAGFEDAEPEKKYKWEGGAIYFPVKRKSQLGIIKGVVKNRDGSAFLAGVLIMIENEFSTRTDSLGRFNFTMPAEQIKDKYTLSFQKKDLNPKQNSIIPNL